VISREQVVRLVGLQRVDSGQGARPTGAAPAYAALRRRTWELRDRCSAYDGCYVGLAGLLGARLSTTDDRLGRSVAGLVEVVSVGDQ
jgi:hypothetical protein